MVRNPSKLQALIEEYGRLRNCQGFTKQSRGQRLNGFIAELLQCWGIQADANIRGKGEIDVAFELYGIQFIVEVKWQGDPVSKDPISKLQSRLRQRLTGTIGILLSMSGFSKEALAQLTDGESFTVLLLSRNHFEAMLSGFVTPFELIDLLRKRASRYGDGFIDLQHLFGLVDGNSLGITFGNPSTLSDKDLVLRSVPDFEARIVASNIPGVLGVAEYSKNQVILTLSEGIYKLDLRKKKIDCLLAIPRCIGNAVVANKMIYVFRGYGIACVHPNGDVRIVGGGVVGTGGVQPHLFWGNNTIYAISSGHIRMEGVDEFNPMITILGEQLGDEGRFKIPGFEPGQSIKAAFVNESSVLVVSALPKWFIGCFTLVDLTGSSKPVWTSTDSKFARSIIRISDRNFIAASQGVLGLPPFHPEANIITALQGIEILRGDIDTDMIETIACLKLPGNSVALASSAYGGGYLLGDYSRNKEGNGSKAVLVRWQYTANNRLNVVH